MNKKQKRIAGNAFVIVLALVGIIWILSLLIHTGGEYTNNAQVHQHIVQVYSRVNGFARDVNFEEFEYVHAGDTLLVVEDSEYRLQLAQAQANYHNASAGRHAMSSSISATENNVAVNDAGIGELEVLLDNAKADFVRYENLFASNSATRQQYDAAKTSYQALLAKLETMQRQKRTSLLSKEEHQHRLGQNDAAIEVCRAAMELALLNLSYTIITAPCSGYTLRKNLHAGEVVNAGKHIVSIVNSNEKWIIANYRETQCRNIHIGSMADITIDAMPDAKFEGIVSAISNATGSQIVNGSHDNAVGNFVKVEQRIPVKIVFTNNNDSAKLVQISAGMNAECTIKY
jgi:membrane fusion protein (multidrug efflux system)